MKNNLANAKLANSHHENRKLFVGFVITLASFVITLASFIVGVASLPEGTKSWIFYIGMIGITLIFGSVLVLYFYQYSLERKGVYTRQDYSREAKRNSIHQAVFDSLYASNAQKIREVLRYTYGSVPQWNPINYHENVLTYDVHEQIRTILISIEETIISFDPDRFNDNNVSVDLVYCYPVEVENDKGFTNVPIKNNRIKSEKEGKEEKNFWKLISSGDMSGNQQNVSSYLSKWDSFFAFVDCCGTVIMNSKFKHSPSKTQIEFVQNRVAEQADILGRNRRFLVECPERPEVDEISKLKFYQKDVRDLEHSTNSTLDGSAIGTVINIRNDNPETVFVKAILTINTYGSPIFVPENDSSSKLKNEEAKVDKHGLTLEDYHDIIQNTILSTYSKELEAELAQMYIRHMIKSKKMCPKTGREIHKATNGTVFPQGCGMCCLEKNSDKKQEAKGHCSCMHTD